MITNWFMITDFLVRTALEFIDIVSSPRILFYARLYGLK